MVPVGRVPAPLAGIADLCADLLCMFSHDIAT
jgi:hypothetical protein